MEYHALQLEELNASAKIAPCGWNPVADRDVQCVSMPFIKWRSDRPTGTPQYYVGKVRNGNLSLLHLNSTGNTGWPKLVGSDSVREVPIWSRSLNSTQGRLVMSSAVGIQSGLSTAYKSKVTMTKAGNRESVKWEKGEVRQRFNILTNPMKEDVCLLTT
jgi:hypothetical protein